MIGRIIRSFGLAPQTELVLLEEKLRTIQQRLEQTTARLAQATAASDALEQELRRRDARLEATARGETELARRVAVALEELQLARASLAAVEVKLDILEGAANVLDRRMRAAAPVRSDEPR